MSEIEKKAIETLKEIQENCKYNTYIQNEERNEWKREKKAIDTILNLVDNQQKEIEEKSTIIMAGVEKVKRLESQIEELLNVLNNEKKINYIKPIDIKVHNYISEDEIRELIKKYQEKAEDVKQKYKGGYAYISDYLEALAKIEGYQELLEENNEESDPL